MFDLVISLVILAALALGYGAYRLWQRGEGRKAGLMALLAVVMVMNAVIWLAPTESGTSLADVAQGEAAVGDEAAGR